MNFVQGKQEGGLSLGTATVADLVYKDTDGDGVPDWEEGLWGTDPTKKETTPGIPDSTAISKMKADQGENTATINGSNPDTEKLTETDKFSRELFATVSALNQSGVMDQATAEKISSSLADKIQNSVPRKIFTLSDIKIIKNDLFQTVSNYNDALGNLYKNPKINYTVMDVLQKFIIDENNVDASALLELDPIIKQTQEIIDKTVKISVPQSFAQLHLDFLNGLENILENISDIRLYDSDVIIALGGISQYEKNTPILQSAIENLTNAVNQKLNN